MLKNPNNSKSTFSFMNFPFVKSLHWKDEVDKSFLDIGFNHKCLLAATSSGKTSAIIRKLSNTFGLLLTCCTENMRNVHSKDALMSLFADAINKLSQNEIYAFGNSYAQLAVIAKYYSLIYWTEFLEARKKQVTPLNFLWFQTNGSTVVAGRIFMHLVSKQYYLIRYDFLSITCSALKTQLLVLLKQEPGSPFPIFVDEAQLFCPNAHKLLADKNTLTPFNFPRKNDLFSLLLNALITVETTSADPSSLIVTGTAFSNDAISLLQSFSSSKQDKNIDVLIGQDLIETKEDFLAKMRSIMNIPKDLMQFIEFYINEFLPMRRRVFTNICAEILVENHSNSNYLQSFNQVFKETADSLVRQAQTFSSGVSGSNRQSWYNLMILKFLSITNISDKASVHKLLPKSINNLKNDIVASGIVPYSAVPANIRGNDWDLSTEKVYFRFDEPLAGMVIQQLCSDFTVEKDDYLRIFKILCPSENENKAKFDVAFSILLMMLASQNKSIAELPFFRHGTIHEILLAKISCFTESSCNFNIKALLYETGLRRYLLAQFEDLSENQRTVLLKILSKESKDDSLYWEVFDEKILRYLLVGICYFPSEVAHSDFLLLIQIKPGNLDLENLGFISFGFKLHGKLKHKKNFKQANAKNTFQACLEYAYSTLSKKHISQTDLKEATLFNITYKKQIKGEAGEKVSEVIKALNLKESMEARNNSANSIPCLPIAVSLHEKFHEQFPEASHHAVQINWKALEEIFPGVKEMLFRERQTD
mmetsp:Transcript_3473/g.5031  ORF Transcript_3473/g.5031 Transcript_3473/m.5031 type:complete len:761 (-) Transcript_3473:215-2497(-)